MREFEHFTPFEHPEAQRSKARASFYDAIKFPQVQSDAQVQLDVRDALEASLAFNTPQELDSYTRKLTEGLHIDRADRADDNIDRREMAKALCIMLVANEHSVLSQVERTAVLSETVDFLTHAYENSAHPSDLARYTAFIRASQDLHTLCKPLRQQLELAYNDSTQPEEWRTSWQAGARAIRNAQFNQWHFRALYNKKENSHS
jgi:hypothetical protein